MNLLQAIAVSPSVVTGRGFPPLFHADTAGTDLSKEILEIFIVSHGEVGRSTITEDMDPDIPME